MAKDDKDKQDIGRATKFQTGLVKGLSVIGRIAGAAFVIMGGVGMFTKKFRHDHANTLPSWFEQVGKNGFSQIALGIVLSVFSKAAYRTASVASEAREQRASGDLVTKKELKTMEAAMQQRSGNAAGRVGDSRAAAPSGQSIV